MTLKEIVGKCETLNVYEKRENTDVYVEFVFFNKDLSSWKEVFSQTFGEPLKPAGSPVTKEHKALTSEYGGINDNQTLYKKDADNKKVIAMLWPWGDNEHTTLKLAVT